MGLYTICGSCKNEISVKSPGITRVDLARERGDEFYVNCKNCGNNSKRHVNEVYAEPNKAVLIGGVILGVVVTAVLWVLVGAIGTFSLAIPVLIYNQQHSNAHAFNGYEIQR